MQEYINKFPWSMTAVDEIHRMYVKLTMHGSQVSKLMTPHHIDMQVVNDIKYSMVNEFNNRLKNQMFFYAVDKEDCTIKWVRVDDINSHEFTLTWNPGPSRPVCFYGGLAHGTIRTVSDIGRPYAFPISPTISVNAWNNTLEVDIPKTVYYLDGWDPEQRHWIFRERSNGRD